MSEFEERLGKIYRYCEEEPKDPVHGTIVSFASRTLGGWLCSRRLHRCLRVVMVDAQRAARGELVEASASELWCNASITLAEFGAAKILASVH